MIRSFDLRDLALVRRLSEGGIPLYTESALTDGLHPLRSALFGIVGGDFPTFVWKADEGKGAGFIQLQLEASEHHAHIAFLSSASDDSGKGANGSHPPDVEATWLHLLDRAVVEVGRRGVHSLVAEVPESGIELPILRRAGFAVYTRQDIWRRDGVAKPASAKENLLSLRQSVDEWEIQLLYANLIPRLVQLVEPEPPLHHGSMWVLREMDEVTAVAHIHTGTEANWLRLFIHPNAEAMADAIVHSAIGIVAGQSSRPIYCCVRRYQSWLQNPLQRAGFVHWASQAVMVKHTVHQARKPAADLKAVLETQGITPTAPFVQQYKHKNN